MIKLVIVELTAALEAAAPSSTAPAQAGQDFEQLVWRANDLLDRAKEAMECDPEADNVGGDCWTWIKQTKIWLEELNRGAALATPSPQAPQELCSAFSTTSAREQSAATASGSPGAALADEILLRIARRYENCSVNIYPDMPCLTPVEAVLRCAQEEGFVLRSVVPAATQEPAGSGASEHQMSSKPVGWQYRELEEAIDGAVLQAGGSPRKVGEDAQPKIWTCKIGEITQERFANLPNGLDFPMRVAIKEAYERITGKEPNFCFSGWGGTLTEGERAVVENRPPNAARPYSAPVGEQKQEEGV